ncbi:MAG: DHH family phosphoesterase [Phycisphaerae bacterium]|nr:DHH family phosphoesterase [Phycisphaerae bacterium]
MSYESTATLPEIAATLRAANCVVVTTHAKPDGDALGSLLALSRALEVLGKDVQRWVMPPVPRSLKFLTEGVQMHSHGGPEDPLPAPEPDAIVIVDTGAWTQLEPLRHWIEPRAERTIVLDHHLMGASFAPQRHIDPQAAAAAEVVAELIDVLGCDYDATICRSLYVALATDTGWFRFSNTRPRTHELAARLLRGGVDHADLFSRLEQSERVQKLALMIRAMDSLKLVAGGRRRS